MENIGENVEGAKEGADMPAEANGEATQWDSGTQRLDETSRASLQPLVSVSAYTCYTWDTLRQCFAKLDLDAHHIFPRVACCKSRHKSQEGLTHVCGCSLVELTPGGSLQGVEDSASPAHLRQHQN